MRAALTTLLTLAVIAAASCEPFLTDLPDLLPPTDGPDAGDTAAPTVFFASPDDNTDVAGTVTLEVSAVDAEGPVSTVSLLIDDVVDSTRAAPPFNFDVDTTALADGARTFKAIATDAADNTAEAVVVLVVTNAAPQLRIDAPFATQSDRDVDIVVTSQVPLRALTLRLGDTTVSTVADDAQLVFTATARVPPASAPAIVVSATGTDDQGQEGSADVAIIVDDTPPTVDAEVQPTTDTHVASPFDVAFAVADEAGAAGAPIASCAVCATADDCDDDNDFVEVDVVDGVCSPRAGISCVAGEVVIAVRVIDVSGNVGTATLTRTCSPAPASAPTVEAIETPPGTTTTITWSGPAPGPGDAGIDHFLLTTTIDGGASTAVEVPGPLSHTLTLPACVVVDVEVVAVDVFGRPSPAGARRGRTHCGHDGTFTPIALELDADGSANLLEMSSIRNLATVASIDAGDVDRDGDLDMVVFGERNNGSRRVLLLEQRSPVAGQPMFVAAPLLDPTANGNARQVELVDLNADGLLDLVAMTPQVTALLAGTGGGSFAVPTVFGVGQASAVVGPVTRGDALPDVLLDADDAILRGTTRGVLTSTACTAGGTLLELADADGLPGAELLVYNSGSDLLRVRKRDGVDPGCPFSAVSTDVYSRTQGNLVTALVLDSDRNGRPDLARLGSREVVIDRDAAFVAPGTNSTASVLMPQNTVAAAAIDLHSDGDDDLVIIDDRSPGSVRFVVVEDGTLTLGDVIPLVGRLQQVQVTDVDGDGIDDVLVAAEAPPAVHVLKGGGVRRRGDGGAVLFHEVEIADAVGAAPFDIDRDGDLDVVSAGSAGVFAIDVDVAGAATVQLTASAERITAFTTGVADAARGTSVFFGTTSGDWTLLDEAGATEVLASAFAPARALGAVDIDDDGDLDSVGIFPQLAVRLNQGASFVAGPAAPTTTTNAVALAVGDVDLDGLLDVVIAGDELNIVSLQPTVAIEGTLACADGPAADVAIVDVDDDGRVDLVAACAGPTPTLLVARNTGGSPATFSLSEVVAGGDSVGPLAAGDLDGDGDADVVLGVVEDGFGALRVLRNDGGGYVVDVDLFGAAGRTFSDLQLIDLDGDGPLDVIATPGDGTVAILHGTSAP